MSAPDDRTSVLYPSERLREVVEAIEAQYAEIMQQEFQYNKGSPLFKELYNCNGKGIPRRLTSVLPRPLRFHDADWRIDGNPEKMSMDEIQRLMTNPCYYPPPALADEIRSLQKLLGSGDRRERYVSLLRMVESVYRMAVLQEYRLELLQECEVIYTGTNLPRELLWREFRHRKNIPLSVCEVRLPSETISLPDFTENQGRFHVEYLSKLRAQTTTQTRSEDQRESDDKAHQANLDRQRRRLKRQLDLEIERVRTISSYLQETVSTLPIDEDEKARLIRELRLKFSEEGEQDNDDIEILG